MDSETVKQDIYEVIHEFLALDASADNETVSTLFTSIKVFSDELPVYPEPQTQAEVDASNLAHGESEADLLYFSDTDSAISVASEKRAQALQNLQLRAKEIERILRADS